ncbi:unnamed protein product [Phaeothamnion confervicola]
MSVAVARGGPSYPAEWARTSQVVSKHAGTVLEDLSVLNQLAELTDEQEAIARAVFSDADPQGRGLIDAAALRPALERLDLRLDDSMFQSLVSERCAGLLRSGGLDMPTFVAVYRTVFAPARTFGAHLRRAAGRGDNAIVRELLLRGCDPHAADGLGTTALHAVASFGRLETGRLLKELSPPSRPLPVRARDYSGLRPLAAAAAAGHAAVVRWLLDEGAEADGRTDAGRTALHAAAGKGRDGCVRALLGGGADASARDDAGWTPLHCASAHGHAGVMRLLMVDGGADAAARDAVGRTPQSYCDERLWQRVREDSLAAVRTSGGGRIA